MAREAKRGSNQNCLTVPVLILALGEKIIEQSH